MMVDPFSYFKQTIQIDEQLTSSLLNASRFCSDFQYDQSYYEAGKSLSLCAKELFNLRELIYSLYAYKENDIANEYQNIEPTLLFDIYIEPIDAIPSVLKITMPFILPNQRSNFDIWKKTIGVSLHARLKDYVKTNNFNRIQSGFIAFVSNFTDDKLKYVCDNDNKEVKDIINIISRTMLKDDYGLICDMYFKSQLTTDKLNTEIYVGNTENAFEVFKLINKQ